VGEMDRLPVDGGTELIELVQSRLLCSPVVRLHPIVDHFTQIIDRHPVVPPRALKLIGKSGPRQAVLQVIEQCIVDVDLKRLDRLAHLHHPFAERALRHPSHTNTAFPFRRIREIDARIRTDVLEEVADA
jgi:hypothetical protein